MHRQSKSGAEIFVSFTEGRERERESKSKSITINLTHLLKVSKHILIGLYALVGDLLPAPNARQEGMTSEREGEIMSETFDSF